MENFFSNKIFNVKYYDDDDEYIQLAAVLNTQTKHYHQQHQYYCQNNLNYIPIINNNHFAIPKLINVKIFY